jgi:hypothetical protein
VEEAQESGKECGRKMGREKGREEGNLCGVGERCAAGVEESRLRAGRKGGGDVGGVRFKEKMAGRDGGQDPAGAVVSGPGDGAAEGDADVFRRECGEGVGGAAVGVEEDAGRVGGLREEEVDERLPGAASVEGDGAAEGHGEVPLGAEGGPLGIGDAAGEGSVEAGFADAGGRVGEKEGTETAGPAGGGGIGVPGMETVGEAEGEAGGQSACGEDGGGGPVGFAGGVGVDAGDAGIAGAAEDGVEVRREAWILEVAMGVGEWHGRRRVAQVGEMHNAE